MKPNDNGSSDEWLRTYKECQRVALDALPKLSICPKNSADFGQITGDDLAELVSALTAATHALRSYEFGNSATDLAAAVANKCEAALAKVRK